MIVKRPKPYNKIEDIKVIRRFSHFMCKLGLKSFVSSVDRPVVDANGIIIGWERVISNGWGLAEAKAFCEKWLQYEKD